jgi:arginase
MRSSLRCRHGGAQVQCSTYLLSTAPTIPELGTCAWDEDPCIFRSAARGLRLRALGTDINEQVVELPGGFPAEIDAAFRLQESVGHAVAAARDVGAFPIVIAGNCNTASIGMAAGGDTSESGIVWFDAHDDFETPESTTTGFLDGMALSMLTGCCWENLRNTRGHFRPVSGSRAALVGTHDASDAALRNLSAAEVELIPVAGCAKRDAPRPFDRISIE